MNIDGFPFEGRQVTAAKLKREGVVYSEGQIQSALESGIKTMPELVAFCEARVAANSRRSYQQGKAAIRSIYG